MRLDRLITLGLVDPVRRAAGLRSPQPGRLPILMYHSISDDPETGVAPYYRTATSPRRFAEQMRFLRTAGWRAVSLREGLQAWEESAPAGDAGRLVVLTFDDGFRDFLTAAVPVLQELGFGATMYLPTAFIAAPGQSREFRGRACLNWAEVAGLDAAGFEFGSHTVSHPKLVELPWPRIEAELSESKSAIEQQLGRPVLGFAYPFAFPQANRTFVHRFLATLRAAGFRSSVTTEIGREERTGDPFRLKRLPVNDADDLDLFRAKLQGAYDWLARPQALVKQARSMFSN